MKISKEEIIIFLKSNIKTIFLSILSSVVIVCGLIYVFSDKKQNDYTVVDTFVEQNNNEESSNEDSKTLLIIDIKGAVKSPGVYEFQKDERVKDAIERAGGLLEDADTSAVNLSQKLKDQMLIVIPRVGEVNSNYSNATATNNKVVNINLATKEELMKINGIGETKAKAIIDYRDNKGEFKTKEDIMKVKGIGKGTFEKIKDEIDV